MKPFEVASVVVPAVDGTLASLGFDVRALQTRALGVVLESKSKKCLVQFPDLKLSLWLSHDEIKDVVFEATQGDPEFQSLCPRPDDFSKVLSEYNIVWWAHRLCHDLGALFLWDVSVADMASKLFLDDQDFDPQKLAPGADFQQPAAAIRLGVSEFDLKVWSEISPRLGDKLIFARFLPAGLQKIEIAVCLAHRQRSA